MKLFDAMVAGLWVASAVLLIWVGVNYRDHVYQLGYDAAVAAGEAELEKATKAARKTESDLRAKLAVRDADAFEKEKNHAASLEAAQRRVRAGIDGLRCPAAIPIQSVTASGNRPATAGPPADEQGAELMPDIAADVLSVGATVAGLVRKYDRLEQRFEECRALNEK